MMKISKASQTTLKAKDIVIVDSSAFIDAETGDVVPVLETLSELFGDQPFELSASKKELKDVAPDEE